MTYAQTALLGAVAGLSIFVGLPVARMRLLPKRLQGFFNAIATGIIIFLLFDVLSAATTPILAALPHPAQRGTFLSLVALFVLGVGVGLLGIVYFNGFLVGRLRDQVASPSPRNLSLMIAGGLGLHNLSEGLAIGQSAASHAVALAGLLAIGFALHNITEGFGVAAPMTLAENRPSWNFLIGAGLMAGGPTFVGTLVGYVATSPFLYVLFLSLAAGALVYVVSELFAVGRRVNSPRLMAWGVLVGFLIAYGTDLYLTYLQV